MIFFCILHNKTKHEKIIFLNIFFFAKTKHSMIPILFLFFFTFFFFLIITFSTYLPLHFPKAKYRLRIQYIYIQVRSVKRVVVRIMYGGGLGSQKNKYREVGIRWTDGVLASEWEQPHMVNRWEACYLFHHFRFSIFLASSLAIDAKFSAPLRSSSERWLILW